MCPEHMYRDTTEIKYSLVSSVLGLPSDARILDSSDRHTDDHFSINPQQRGKRGTALSYQPDVVWRQACQTPL